VCTLIVPWSLQDSGNLAAVLYRRVSPTTTIPLLGMTGPVEDMGPVGIYPHQLLAENWLFEKIVHTLRRAGNKRRAWKICQKE
jgi:hypothetical protein